MKTTKLHILNLFLIIFFVAPSFAQKPEKIYGYAKVSKSNEYYLEQIELWKKEISKNSKNADAWFNYYRANRNAHLTSESQTGKSHNRFERLKKIVDEMEKNVPNSFEFNFVKWMNGWNDPSLLPYLDKAYKLNPNSFEVLIDMATQAEIARDFVNRDKYLNQWFDTGECSPGLLNYNYNVLSGLEPNAIVLTHGDNDTYPILILQAKGYRKDVSLINLSLLYLKNYREKIFKEFGLPALSSDPLESEEGNKNFIENIIKIIAENKNQRPVYTALTLGENFTKSVSSNLYLTGLALKYSTSEMDNIAILKNNFENKMALDYLNFQFNVDISQGIVKFINMNYLAPLVKLHEHYNLAGENAKAEKMKKLAMLIAKDANREEELKNYFK